MPKYLITEKVLIAVFSYRSYVETKLVFSFGIKVVRFKEFSYHVCWNKKNLEYPSFADYPVQSTSKTFGHKVSKSAESF